MLQLMAAEAMKTSTIEGEVLNRPNVMSSIRHRWGLDPERPVVKDRAAEGAVELMVAVRQTWEETLDQDTLFNWHRMLMVENSWVARACRTYASYLQSQREGTGSR